MTKGLFAALIAATLLIVLAASAIAGDTRPVRCYPRPTGTLPASAVMYSGPVAQDLLDAVAPSSNLPPMQALVAMERGPDVVVVLLSGVMACPLPVDRQAWEAARRKVLGRGA